MTPGAVSASLRAVMLGAVMVLAAAIPASAFGATVTVNTTADNPVTGTYCTGTGPTDCSLRQAVVAAGAGGTVDLPAGSYKLSLGAIPISSDLTIDGTGLPTIDGQGNGEVLAVTGAPAVTISDVEITGGNFANGSAIGTDGGALTLTGDTFTGNVAGGAGVAGNGSVYVNATAATSLTITNSTFTGEHSGGGNASGNGIVNATTSAGNMTTDITTSTFTGNFVGGGGSNGTGFGVLWLSPATATSTTTIDSSTFDENTLGGGGGSGFGGGISMETSPVGTLTITNSHFDSNVVGGDGAGGTGGALDIEGSGTITVSGSTFNDNIVGGPGGSGQGSGSGFGGGISLEGLLDNLTVTNSTFSGNTLGGNGGTGDDSGTAFGGGISDEAQSDLLVTGSTFDDNTLGGAEGAGRNSGDAFGGAISYEGNGATTNGGLTITNTTMTGNSAGGSAADGGGGTGGAIDDELSHPGSVTLTNDTIDANSAGGPSGYGGGLYIGNAVTVRNTILSGNLAAGVPNDCGDAVSASDHNIEHGASSCGFNQPGDSSADPLLDPLANNGGPTETQIPETVPVASPAIDAGDPAVCPAIDQRGNPRPDAGGTACDIGAVETAPPGAVTVQPGSLQFSAAPLATSAAQSVTVTNSGTSDLTFGPSALTVTGADQSDFAVSADTCSGQTIAVSNSCSFKVSFTAPSVGAFTAKVQIADSAADSPQSVALSGTGGAPGVLLRPASLSFGSPSDRIAKGATASNATVITNNGTTPLVLGTLGLAGAQASAFTITSDGCSGRTLAVGGTCSVTVLFNPGAAGTFAAALTIPDNAPGNPHSVALSGFAGIPTATVSPASLSFRQPGGGTVTVTNSSSDTELLVSGATLSGPDASYFLTQTACTAPVPPGGHCDVSVGFSPRAKGTFQAQLHISDDAPDSPQTVDLSADVVAELVGTIVDTNGKPLAGAMIGACPEGRLFTSDCRSGESDSTGGYGLALGAGTWIIQVSPPAGSRLDGANAQDVVSATAVAVQNFTLAPPTPLSGGFSVDGQTSGVPVVNAFAAYTLGVPLPIPATGTPNTMELFTGFAGLDGGAESTNPDLQYVQLGMILISAHYGADGHVDGISDPILGGVDCGASSPSACADAASFTASAASAARDSGDARSSRARITPIAHASARTDEGCGLSENRLHSDVSVTDVELEPNAQGGVDVVTKFSDGTSDTFILDQVAIQTFVPQAQGQNPWSDAGINLANQIPNDDPTINSYNTMIGILNSAANAAKANNDPANWARYVTQATWEVATRNVSGKYHGAARFLWNLTSAYVSNTLTPGSSNTVNPNFCWSDVASGYIDPSGTVKTTSGIPVKGAAVTLSHKSGKRLVKVPNGNPLMSPANRRNPSVTNVLGAYGWDVLPGSYEITARHSGCTAARHGKIAKSKLLSVPPAATGVDLTLRCPSIRRATAKLRLAIVKPSAHSTVILVATLTGRRHGARPQGTVTFSVGRRNLGTLPVSMKSATARLWLPPNKLKGRLKARYSGDANYAPAAAGAPLR